MPNETLIFKVQLKRVKWLGISIHACPILLVCEAQVPHQHHEEVVVALHCTAPANILVQIDVEGAGMRVSTNKTQINFPEYHR